MTVWICRALLCTFLFGAPQLVWAAANDSRPPIVFSCPIDPKVEIASVINELYRQAFDALGYNFKMLYLPSMRSLGQLQEGKLDGECGRIKEVKENENLLHIVRVDMKLMTLRLQLFTYKPELIGITKEDVFNSKLRIGIQLGAISIDRELQRADSSLNIHFTQLAHGLNMLKAGRIDLLAGPDLLTQAAINKIQLDSVPVIAADLGDFEIYPYLTQSRAELAEPLAHELARLLKAPNHPLRGFAQ